ncbi:MAG: hypothetical protein WCL44_04175 [bacterium]
MTPAHRICIVAPAGAAGGTSAATTPPLPVFTPGKDGDAMDRPFGSITLAGLTAVIGGVIACLLAHAFKPYTVSGAL